MTDITVEFFTDPFSPWCWQCEPVTRKLRFRFGTQFEWIPRMTVFLPDGEHADDVPPEFVVEDETDPPWKAGIDGRRLPVVESLWEADLPRSSRPACHAVASLRESQPDKADLLLRYLRESTFVAGDSPETVADIEALVEKHGLDIGWSFDDRVLTTDIERACDVASEIDDGVSVEGPVKTVEVGPRFGQDKDDPTMMIAPPCLRLEREGKVVVISPRSGYGSLENALRKLAPSLQTSRVGHMEQIIDNVASRTTREIAEEFGTENIKSKIKDYMKQFTRAFLAEISFGVDATPTKSSRILFQLEEASIVEPIYADEVAAWAWKEPSG